MRSLIPITLLAVATDSASQSPQEGHVLFAPLQDTNTHLLDNSGNVLHSWPSTDRPGNAVYLMDNGDLLRTLNLGVLSIGGAGGGIERRNFDGDLLWQWDYSTGGVLAHHDVERMPNGNLLMIAWEDKTRAEAIAAGRNPSYLSGPTFRPDHIIEIEPSVSSGATIVWEWHLWDHVIQDYDSSKPNYGVVADHPELVNLNYPAVAANQGDWAHVNSVAYHPVLDQIVMSSHNHDEIWVIDHSTTTAEAAGHTGGNSGKGGDLLYRWGNPACYDAGVATDQKLFGQHDAQWIPADRPGAGNLLIYNNGMGRPAGAYSTIEEITPPVDASGNYTLTPGAAYGPSATTWNYTATPPTSFYSGHISGAERQANGNTLICEGSEGRLFEVDSSGTTVWEHINDLPSASGNSIFKVRRYSRTLWNSADQISATSGGTIHFELVAGNSYANRNYVLLGCLSGTNPGTWVGSLNVPLNRDAFTDLILANLNNTTFDQFQGSFDANGMASAVLDTLGPISSSLAGSTAHFSYLTTAPADFAADAVEVLILP